ncbi:MAG: GNAT family N-acetyltransferase [Pseudomonadota bacterium]
MTTFTIPTLETERLLLRAPQLSDFDVYADFFASERAQFVGGPLTRERAWRSLATEAGHWILLGFGRWALEEKATGAFVGNVGLWHPEGFPERELGWDLMAGAEGKGYATEAAQAARAYAYDTLGWTTLISLVADQNHASRRVAERMGCQHDGAFTHAVFGTSQIWRHPSPAALAEAAR